MQADFRPPKKRSRIQEEYEGPLPVNCRPAESCEFRAELINQHVLVCHPEHIKMIHKQVWVQSAGQPADFKHACYCCYILNMLWDGGICQNEITNSLKVKSM